MKVVFNDNSIHRMKLYHHHLTNVTPFFFIPVNKGGTLECSLSFLLELSCVVLLFDIFTLVIMLQILSAKLKMSSSSKSPLTSSKLAILLSLAF
jgi:hypothetical protein